MTPIHFRHDYATTGTAALACYGPHPLGFSATNDLDRVTCPDCLRNLADYTADKLRAADASPVLDRLAYVHGFPRLPGETDAELRRRLAEFQEPRP